jgi:hypothetical protein
MTYTLVVSHNCGISYYPEQSSENLDDLRPKMKELDKQMLRWCIDKDGEQIVDDLSCVCAIHKGIFEFLEKENK